MKQELQKALRLIIDFSYEQSLKEYLSANILANEIDFINYITNNQKETINDLKPKIDFFFNNKIDTEEEYLNLRKRDTYWFFIEYQKYIDEKRHVLNKEVAQLVKTLQPPHEPAPEVVNTELLEQIRQRFETMDKKGYQYAFRTEDEFYSFCNVLALYFDNGTFNDIETVQLNPRTKTRIASTLNLIYSKFIKDDLSLKTNKDFFRIVRFLAPYKEKTDDEIYKALTR